MLYKMNKFFREWAGYEKVYSFFKNNFIIVLAIKTFVYIFFPIILMFFDHSNTTHILRILVYLSLAVIEYFFGNIEYEEGFRHSAFLSRFLLFLCLVCVILYSSALCFGLTLPLFDK